LDKNFTGKGELAILADNEIRPELKPRKQISRTSWRVLLSLLVVLTVLLAASAWYILDSLHKYRIANETLAENKLLKEKFTQLSTEIDSIMTRLETMEDWEESIRKEHNLKEINKEIREMGLGGLPLIDTTFSSSEAAFNLNYNLTLNRLNQLESKLNFNYQTHQEVIEQLQLQESLYLNTPSIYPTYGRISEGFGWRTHPITKRRNYHNGLDFANTLRTPIYATAQGKVVDVGRKKYFGRYITIKHKFGYTTKYAHLHKSLVKEGDWVERGQIIAEMGNTGRSTGAHLHYEVLRYNRHRNPYNYLNKQKQDIVITKK